MVTVCSLLGESRCPSERVEAEGLAVSAGFLRICLVEPGPVWQTCLLVCGGSGDGWRARRAQNVQLLGDLCVASARMVEGVERFGEVAQQDAERFLIEYRWVRRACGSFEGRCVAERTGVDRCGLDQVGTCPVVCVRNQAGHVLLDGRQDEVLGQDEAARSECGGEKNDATGMNRSLAWVHVWAFGRPGRQLVGLWMRRRRRMCSRIDVFMSDAGLWRREVVVSGGSSAFVTARIARESASEERGRLPDASRKSL